MICRFQVKNFKALRDVSLDLTPIHVLIGPNDSGKSSLLQAMSALSRSVDSPLDQAFTGLWELADLVWQRDTEQPVTLSVVLDLKDQARIGYGFQCRFRKGMVAKPSNSEYVCRAGGVQEPLPDRGRHGETTLFSIHDQGLRIDRDASCQVSMDQIQLLAEHLSGAQSYRWFPGFLALPTAPDLNRRFRMEASGFGLALCLDDILGYDRDKFGELEHRFREIFPAVRSIKLIPVPAFRTPTNDTTQIPNLERADGKGIFFEMVQGRQLLPASQVSDGMLLVLAYLAVLNLPTPPRLLLIEEPENGVHPKRLAEIIGILRDLVRGQSQTQVVMTTHSPYVLDLFSPEEVTLCQRDTDGAVSVHPLSQSATIREQIDVFTLGEIWTAEGDEALVWRVGGSA